MPSERHGHVSTLQYASVKYKRQRSPSNKISSLQKALQATSVTPSKKAASTAAAAVPWGKGKKHGNDRFDNNGSSYASLENNETEPLASRRTRRPSSLQRHLGWMKSHGSVADSEHRKSISIRPNDNKEKEEIETTDSPRPLTWIQRAQQEKMNSGGNELAPESRLPTELQAWTPRDLVMSRNCDRKCQWDSTASAAPTQKPKRAPQAHSPRDSTWWRRHPPKNGNRKSAKQQETEAKGKVVVSSLAAAAKEVENRQRRSDDNAFSPVSQKDMVNKAFRRDRNEGQGEAFKPSSNQPAASTSSTRKRWEKNSSKKTKNTSRKNLSLATNQGAVGERRQAHLPFPAEANPSSRFVERRRQHRSRNHKQHKKVPDRSIEDGVKAFQDTLIHVERRRESANDTQDIEKVEVSRPLLLQSYPTQESENVSVDAVHNRYCKKISKEHGSDDGNVFVSQSTETFSYPNIEISFSSSSTVMVDNTSSSPRNRMNSQFVHPPVDASPTSTLAVVMNRSKSLLDSPPPLTTSSTSSSSNTPTESPSQVAETSYNKVETEQHSSSVLEKIQATGSRWIGIASTSSASIFQTWNSVTQQPQPLPVSPQEWRPTRGRAILRGCMWVSAVRPSENVMEAGFSRHSAVLYRCNPCYQLRLQETFDDDSAGSPRKGQRDTYNLTQTVRLDETSIDAMVGSRDHSGLMLPFATKQQNSPVISLVGAYQYRVGPVTLFLAMEAPVEHQLWFGGLQEACEQSW